MATESKTLTRRQLFKGTGALATATMLTGCNLFGSKPGVYLSAFRDHLGQNHIAGLNTDGESLFSIAVPQRAHDSLMLPGAGLALFFARRPGNLIYIVDLARGQWLRSLQAPEGHHFYGHGCVSGGGRYLLTTENHIADGNGHIGVYDINDEFRRVEQLPSHGIGPHQLKSLSDGKTLAIANGGILTHPDKGREKLNLDTMQPGLAYVELNSGKLLSQYHPPHHQQSIRHMDITSADEVVVGVQFEGDPDQVVPLAYTHRGEDQLQPLPATDASWRQHRNYIASVCVDADGERLLLSSPRGGVVSGWDLSKRQLLAIQTQRDGAGIAFNGVARRFLISNGLGQLTAVDQQQLQRQTHHSRFYQNRIWDNHMSFSELPTGTSA
ncbi:DUF1513 domain-containing protein [Pseudomaricurvus alkylphenolicus]|uniref:DUF1513 domain-containing protein n=1 Tax=Pseudomaricurvus alkylphenolicus TaxID=1306991 RepID=UPI0014240D16|nr:DUF1513 domain-containing protein [Pseudomaricurvus alkylphenolicus]NIB39901.1 DUF1513 domain-containing protein [Pseudomaricurvus alkylphenolicus]